MIPFNKPYHSRLSKEFVNEVFKSSHLSGGGYYDSLCVQKLKEIYLTEASIVLTPSCTSALEISALVCGILPGDEIIVPSYTFVSTANAFALRGAKLIFCEIDAQTLCIDLEHLQNLITPNTKAIVCVHYSGRSPDMERLLSICRSHNIFLIEDAAQSIGSTYKNQPLGNFGDLACISFHETKNIQCGEGGALIVNNKNLLEKVYIAKDKGTDRQNFINGQIDKYSWVGLGSSYLTNELTCAYLYGQLCDYTKISSKRLELYNTYANFFVDLGAQSLLNGQSKCTQHNGHIFYLKLRDKSMRNNFIEMCRSEGIHTVFHYIPLHSSPFIQTKQRVVSSLPITDNISDTIARLPMWFDMNQDQILSKLKAIIPSFI